MADIQEVNGGLTGAEIVANNSGFWVGDTHLGRLDGYDSVELANLRATLEAWQQQIGTALDGIQSVEEARYEADTQGRIGKWAVQ